MDDKTRVTLMLDALAELQNQRELIKADKQAAINSVLTPEIQNQIAAVETEFGDQLAAADEKIAELERAVKQAVVAHGETVKNGRLMAVWNNPRVSWDAKRLDGYAAAHPEILAFRTVGEPSVSIRQQ